MKEGVATEKISDIEVLNSGSWLIFSLSVLLIVGLGIFLYTGTEDSSGNSPEIEGEIIDVVVEEGKAEPLRPRISPEDGVRFVNNEEKALNFTFDRSVEDFVLEPGESKLVDVDVIIYYEIDTVEKDGFRKIVGGVNVQ